MRTKQTRKESVVILNKRGCTRTRNGLSSNYVKNLEQINLEKGEDSYSVGAG